MEVVVENSGAVRFVYSETLDLRPLGPVHIRRGSHVEPTCDGKWTADLSPVGGPMLGPYATRSEAIEAELTWLAEHWLLRAD